MLENFIKNKKIKKFFSNFTRIKFLINIYLLQKNYWAAYKWYLENGDKKLRYDYKLNRRSIVFDLGAYKGEFTEKIYKKFSCRVFAFEPVNLFYKKLIKKFKNIRNIQCYPFALGKKKKKYIYLNNDSSSFFKKNSDKLIIEEKNINYFLQKKKIKKIDLIKINIEGAEYDFLDFVIKKKIIKKIDNIQVQFHEISPKSFFFRNKIINKLSKTHVHVKEFPFVWDFFKNKFI